MCFVFGQLSPVSGALFLWTQIFASLGKCKTSDYDRNKPSVESCRPSQNLAESAVNMKSEELLPTNS